MLRLSAVLSVLLATVALGATGCGGSDESEEDPATPAEAVTEIGELKTLLATAVDQVRAGDAVTAEQTVGDAYLEHFEPVEEPLGERDKDLMEELEEAISTTLREEIKDGRSVEVIEATVEEIDTNLDKAVELLQS
jgi:high-affinity iron transporter